MKKRQIIIAIVIVVAIAIAVASTLSLLKIGVISTSTSTQAYETTGKAKEKTAITLENSGKTQDALDAYTAAYNAYKSAGDTMNANQMNTKIIFMNEFLDAAKKQETTQKTYLPVSTTKTDVPL